MQLLAALYHCPFVISHDSQGCYILQYYVTLQCTLLTRPIRSICFNKIISAFLHMKYIYVFRIILTIHNDVFPKPIKLNNIPN